MTPYHSASSKRSTDVLSSISRMYAAQGQIIDHRIQVGAEQ